MTKKVGPDRDNVLLQIIENLREHLQMGFLAESIFDRCPTGHCILFFDKCANISLINHQRPRVIMKLLTV